MHRNMRSPGTGAVERLLPRVASALPTAKGGLFVGFCENKQSGATGASGNCSGVETESASGALEQRPELLPSASSSLWLHQAAQVRDPIPSVRPPRVRARASHPHPGVRHALRYAPSPDSLDVTLNATPSTRAAGSRHSRGSKKASLTHTAM